jgi:hypothetical protein
MNFLTISISKIKNHLSKKINANYSFGRQEDCLPWMEKLGPRTALFLWFLNSFSTGIAQNVFVSGTKIYLHDQNCEKLKQAKSEVCTGFRRSSSLAVKSFKCEKSKKSNLHIRLDDCLPNFITEILNKRLFSENANCWGTALSLKNIIKPFESVYAEEMMYWLESPLCRRLQKAEEIKPGDLLNVWGPEKLDESERVNSHPGTEFLELKLKKEYKKPQSFIGDYTGYHRLLHSETFLFNQWLIGKDSPHKDDMIKVKRFENVYGRSVDKDCQENSQLSPYKRVSHNPPKIHPRDKCAYFTTVSRCENLDDFLLTQSLSLSEINLLAEINQIAKFTGVGFQLLIGKRDIALESALEICLDYFKIELKLTKIKLKEVLESDLDSKRIEEMLLVRKYFMLVHLTQELDLKK